MPPMPPTPPSLQHMPTRLRTAPPLRCCIQTVLLGQSSLPPPPQPLVQPIISMWLRQAMPRSSGGVCAVHMLLRCAGSTRSNRASCTARRRSRGSAASAAASRR
eukprot:3496725-Prymnesium_polylepis.1